MSLISTLLRPSLHPAQKMPATSSAAAKQDALQQKTYRANIEKVFQAIKDGHNTYDAISAKTGISRLTVSKACHALESPLLVARIKRHMTKPAHTFEALS